jgi:putative DNA base modification enzyme with NMAD domain
MTLYSYCLRYDDGAAPNPYHGICTLTICKPAVRRVAKPGDWIVGLGGSHSRIGDISGYVVYAMRITKRLTLRDYDTFCRSHLRGKIPKWASRDFIDRVGDCIYDFARPHGPTLRDSVHGEQNREVDLGGKNALLSERFYYFGDHPVPLPAHLRPIVHQTQGHKSRANARYAAEFIDWVEGLGLEPNGLYGEPQLRREIMADADGGAQCSARDLEEDEDDQIC